MAHSSKTLIAFGSTACVVAMVATYSAIRFAADGNDEESALIIAIMFVMGVLFLSGVCAILLGVCGNAPQCIRNMIGIDGSGRSAPTGNPTKDREISPVWALLALCGGFFVLLFL
ncbi:MAG: hypothetical protein ACE37H_17910 [Phycisphaeraceae bacterium]